MNTLWQDLQYGVRMLLKNPGFSAVAVITLALGIGANTAMFSVLNTYLFRLLPYPQSDRLVRIFRTSPHSQSWPHSPGNFFEHRQRSDSFEYMAAYNFTSPTLASPGEPAERLQGMGATADFFPALAVQAELGRVFTPEEQEPNADLVAVLSHRFWMNRFGGDPSAVGRKIHLDGKDVEIVGVMPPSFEHPLLWGNVDLWRPLSFTPEQKVSRQSNYLRSFGRLKAGLSLKQAEQEMVVIAATLASEHPENAGESLRLDPLQRSTSDSISRNVMWFTFGLAGFVLLIACANLANLQLIRTAARTREYAVRSALGAGRGRLIRQSLTESLAISLIGGSFSIVVAIAAVQFISRRLFSQLPGAMVALDFRVFGFALLCSILTGLLFGTVPAWLASRTDLNQALKQNMRGSTAGRSQHRLRNALVVGEVAFALILLAGGGLFLRGLQRFVGLDPGWKVDGLLTAQVSTQGAEYSTGPKRTLFYQKLEERIAALPGVTQVALSSSLPVWGFNSSGSFRIEGEPEPEPGKWPEVYFEPVTTKYFDTYGIHILEGRAFTSDDVADKPDVVIINQTMARRFWPNESAVGKRIGRPGPDPHWQIVAGVVNDVSFPANLSEPYTHLQAYRPLAQQPWSGINIAMRTATTPEALTNSLRAAVAEIDPTQAVHRIQTARSLVDQGLGNVSLLASLLGGFAALGLILAAVGIYGVTSYSVIQRTSEIGIRMALGAQPKDVLWLVLSKGGRLVLTGAVIGFGGAYAVARLLMSLIPSLPAREPQTLVAISVALLAIALLACYIPARRATKVDPMVVLRYE
jgi:putative ABC transport system permease protein